MCLLRLFLESRKTPLSRFSSPVHCAVKDPSLWVMWDVHRYVNGEYFISTLQKPTSRGLSLASSEAGPWASPDHGKMEQNQTGSYRNPGANSSSGHCKQLGAQLSYGGHCSPSQGCLGTTWQAGSCLWQSGGPCAIWKSALCNDSAFSSLHRWAPAAEEIKVHLSYWCVKQRTAFPSHLKLLSSYEDTQTISSAVQLKLWFPLLLFLLTIRNL